MIEGKIIKFYREKAGLTQGQLAENICSVTHLSKIERGITEYSKEIITFLSEKLYIDMDIEIDRYQKLHTHLDLWQDSLISQRAQEAESIKAEIDKEELIQLPDFKIYYTLLLVRYYLSRNQLDKALEQINWLQKNETSFSPHDRNMLKHVLGIYYFLTYQFRDCIEVLKSIDQTQYNQLEYYYHLAIAYHSINSNIIAYYYAEKVLHYFQKTLNVYRIIDTEMIMLIQLNSRELYDFEETKERYHQLINMCDACNAIDRKAKLYHNLAFEHFRRKKFLEASELYLKSIDLVNHQSPQYLDSLNEYIHTCTKGNLLSKDQLIKLAKKGLKLAKSAKSHSWINFQLRIHELNEKNDNYYRFIEKTALPFFEKNGIIMLTEHYEKKLFHYYYEIGDKEKAMNIANSRILSRKSFYYYE